jgi:hypothetical protein
LNDNGEIVPEDPNKITFNVSDKEDLMLVWKRPDGIFIAK